MRWRSLAKLTMLEILSINGIVAEGSHPGRDQRTRTKGGTRSEVAAAIRFSFVTPATRTRVSSDCSEHGSVWKRMHFPFLGTLLAASRLTDAMTLPPKVASGPRN